jgi:hypothetical protein
MWEGKLQPLDKGVCHLDIQLINERKMKRKTIVETCLSLITSNLHLNVSWIYKGCGNNENHASSKYSKGNFTYLNHL